MKKLIPILLSALMLTGCAGAGNQPNSYRQISMDEAVAMMEQESGYIILDVRTPRNLPKSIFRMPSTFPMKISARTRYPHCRIRIS